MSIEQRETLSVDEGKQTTGCPIDHSAWSAQKTKRDNVIQADDPIHRDEAGVWHVQGFDDARTILRSANAKQAGFGKEMMDIMDKKSKMRPAILYQEGKDHLLQRKQTARFFTPKAVDSSYRKLMETVAEDLLTDLKHKQHGDLSYLTRFMAVRVAAEVVGLTNSLLPGMDKRINTFFEGDLTKKAQHMTPKLFFQSLKNQFAIMCFFLVDVKPAIKARKRSPKEDVISHLIAQNYTNAEILIECVTYAAAGMVTTREFISVAAWHLLEDTELRTRYLAAPEKERYDILNEILRLEPIVRDLYRRTTADIEIQSGDQQITIPEGELVNVHVMGANSDESVIGEQPMELCPGRPLAGSQIPSALMSFGDGIHRCPGSYIAIQESDMFLQRLLSIEGLHIAKQPKISWNAISTGYEIRDFQLAIN